jgi:hypothetical protein
MGEKKVLIYIQVCDPPDLGCLLFCLKPGPLSHVPIMLLLENTMMGIGLHTVPCILMNLGIDKKKLEITMGFWEPSLKGR